MEITFKVGDLVRHKAGGPQWAVEQIGDHYGTIKVWCSRIDAKGNTLREVFPPEVLELVQPSKPNDPEEDSYITVRR